MTRSISYGGRQASATKARGGTLREALIGGETIEDDDRQDGFRSRHTPSSLSDSVGTVSSGRFLLWDKMEPMASILERIRNRTRQAMQGRVKHHRLYLPFVSGKTGLEIGGPSQVFRTGEQ